MDKKKILKIITVIVILFLIILLIHTIRNYIIISKIITKQSEIAPLENYTMVWEYMSAKTGNKQIIEQYYKDGKALRNIKSEERILMIDWYDEETKEYIVIITDENVASIDTKEKTKERDFSFPFILLETGTLEKVKMALTSIISSTKINNEECYLIKGKTMWHIISKASGKVLQYYNENGYGEGIMTDFQPDSVNDEIVQRPDLTKLKVNYL